MEKTVLVVILMYLVGSGFGQVDEQVTQLARYYGNRISLYKADILEKAFFARLYKVINVPTIIVLKDGKEIKRLEKGFYWGSVYDLIFKGNIFTLSESALPPSALPPSESAAGPPARV
ncbi:unnamed protein product [Brassica rapa]|uniref:Thioredoxin domain-containing protein n=1 Tax=Brassica campestris TaxID=3711 RepID=A0A8D9D6D8_BRACM|nr:unnamed protein product [Brassica rapa]